MAVDISRFKSWLNNILFNPSVKFFFPICNAACAKYILSECIRAFFKFFGPLYDVNVVISNSPHPSFFQLSPLYVNVSSTDNVPVVSPIAPVIGLNVDPGI